MRRSGKGSFIYPRIGGNEHSSIDSRVTGKCAHVYGVVSNDGFNVTWLRRATWLYRHAGVPDVGSVELRTHRHYLSALAMVEVA